MILGTLSTKQYLISLFNRSKRRDDIGNNVPSCPFIFYCRKKENKKGKIIPAVDGDKFLQQTKVYTISQVR